MASYFCSLSFSFFICKNCTGGQNCMRLKWDGSVRRASVAVPGSQGLIPLILLCALRPWLLSSHVRPRLLPPQVWIRLTALVAINLDPQSAPGHPQAGRDQVGGPQRLSTLCFRAAWAGSCDLLGYGKQSAILPPPPSVLLLMLIPWAQRPRRKYSNSRQRPAHPCSPNAWFPAIGLSSNKPKPKSQFTPELTPVFWFLSRLSVIYSSNRQYAGTCK